APPRKWISIGASCHDPRAVAAERPWISLAAALRAHAPSGALALGAHGRLASPAHPRRSQMHPSRLDPSRRSQRIIGRATDRPPEGSQGMASYAFVTEWRLDAPIERVYEAIHDTLAWPDWWPAVTKVEEIRPPTDRTGVGAVRRYTFKGKLP